MPAKYLRHPTIPFQVKTNRPVSDILASMAATGFQGKTLGEAYLVWREMLRQKKIVVWLGISGAIVPAGMRPIISWLVANRFVDVIVSTGAQVFHDAAEALGVRHYQGSPSLDDKALLKAGVDRFYDVLVLETAQRQVDRQVQQFIESLNPDYQYSSREFLYLLGMFIKKRSRQSNSFLVAAAEAGVPVFAPALADSSIGYSFVLARRNQQPRFIDQMKDIEETAALAKASHRSGVVYLGGGVPKNFIQQTELLNNILGRDLRGHEYAIQITTDTPQFGGLSGCTFQEAQSWGKIAGQAKMVQCFCDVTIALPLLAQGLSDDLGVAKRRKKPVFDWSGEKMEII
ncbi:deoxyhypusine synthase [candidate division WOR-1 bacterium RIFOXYB2_FULL_48_7]|uniref:Deoxyhypusine synthase n=1 Tax=candidate division WOR-1 bacterium RIFOXYB2_FULL_48_7 TaxID=1802583 RepID=A0A1F4TWH1_UNCSA|nr:MAG: deoxyhypusine synthase [candidate division WOR-1 bacterium RIFOXYB2_FULL_48_7]